MYMYRAAVHSLDAEFTVLEMTTTNAFFLVSSRFCTISYMLLSCQLTGELCPRLQFLFDILVVFWIMF